MTSYLTGLSLWKSLHLLQCIQGWWSFMNSASYSQGTQQKRKFMTEKKQTWQTVKRWILVKVRRVGTTVFFNFQYIKNMKNNILK